MSPEAARGILPAAPRVAATPASINRMSRLARGWVRARRRPLALAGAGVVLLFAILAFGAPWIAPSDPLQTDWAQIRKPPTWAHPFGTDDLGRDVLSRIVWGARASMQAGVFAVVLAIAVGLPTGLVAGFYRGAFDQIIMRLTDAWLSFPFLILAIGLVTILGPRSPTRRWRSGSGPRPRTSASRAASSSPPRRRTTCRARAPSARATSGSCAGTSCRTSPARSSSRPPCPSPAAIIAEAILSFLGLGVQPPTPSWGTMLNAAQQFLESAPWMAWWPGLAIFSLTLSFNLAGDGLRDWLDPKD